MEEEETEGYPDDLEQKGHAKLEPQEVAKLIYALIEERRIILADQKLSPRQCLELLEETRKSMYTAEGGKIGKTDEVVYALLTFSGVVLVILALLTVYKGLASDIVLSFAGTVLGGTIATISQKLGRL